MRTFFTGLPLIGVLFVLTGCVASLAGYPDSSADLDRELKQLEPYFAADVVKKCNDEPDPNKKRAWRDEVVNGRIRAVNLHFNVFEQAIYKEGVSLNLATDWVVLVLGGAGATAGDARTKQILAAISGGITGGKAAFDKHAYFEKTMPALLSQMTALRKTTLLKIQTGLSKGVDEYQCNQALMDVEDYYAAGTIPGAIKGITEAAGATAADADKKMTVVLSKLRPKEFVSLERQARVKQLLERIDKLSDDKALDLEKAPPVRDREVEKIVALRDPTDQRRTKGQVAKEILKMRVVLSERDDTAIDAWEAAVRAAEQ